MGRDYATSAVANEVAAPKKWMLLVPNNKSTTQISHDIPVAGLLLSRYDYEIPSIVVCGDENVIFDTSNESYYGAQKRSMLGLLADQGFDSAMLFADSLNDLQLSSNSGVLQRLLVVDGSQNFSISDYDQNSNKEFFQESMKSLLGILRNDICTFNEVNSEESDDCLRFLDNIKSELLHTGTFTEQDYQCAQKNNKVKSISNYRVCASRFWLPNSVL